MCGSGCGVDCAACFMIVLRTKAAIRPLWPVPHRTRNAGSEISDAIASIPVVQIIRQVTWRVPLCVCLLPVLLDLLALPLPKI